MLGGAGFRLPAHQALVTFMLVAATVGSSVLVAPVRRHAARWMRGRHDW
jgi:hypothetical protein